ncbi:cytochrome P450 [Candidatus Palauibacter sp.]|uniref:cytochrome P450 n=1 Tax=Candidatus Palauibacter sp. TaxID=3101350 RepID=UPI003B520358
MGRLHEAYGDIVFYRIPGQDCCAVFDADLINEFMSERYLSFPPFQDESSYGIMKSPGVFRTHGEPHRALHAIIDEAFDEDHMPYHIDVMIEHVQSLGAGWRDEQVVDAREAMARLVTGVMQDSIFGRDSGVNAEMAAEALWALKYDWALNRIPLKTSWLRGLPIPQNRRSREAIRTFDGVIYETIRKARDDSRDGLHMVSLFVQAGEREESQRMGILDTDEKIRDEAYSIALGNSDPPLNALVHVVYYLSSHPEVREKVEREVEEVIGDRPVTAEDYNRLPCARAVFRETVRLQPPAYAGTGQLRVTGSDLELKGYRIPEGTMIHPCAGVPHRKTEYWDEAEEFRPERWMPPDEQPPPGCPAHAYMPFGLDPRRCPADKFATILSVLAMAHLVRRFRLDPVSGEPPRPEALGVGVRGPYFATVVERAAPARYHRTTSHLRE